MAEVFGDTGVGVQRGKAMLSVIEITCLLFLPALGLGPALCHPPAPPNALSKFSLQSRVGGDRTSPRGVNSRVVIQRDETVLSGVS